MNTKLWFILAIVLIKGMGEATILPRASNLLMSCDSAQEVVLIPARLPSTDSPTSLSIVRFLKSKPARHFSETFDLRYDGAGMGKQAWQLFKAGTQIRLGQIILKSNQAYDDGISPSLELDLPSGMYSDCRWFAGQILAITTAKRTVYLIAKNPKGDVRDAKNWKDLGLTYQSFDYAAAPTNKASTEISGGSLLQLKNGTKRFSFVKKGYVYQIDLDNLGNSSISVLRSARLLSREMAMAQGFVVPANLK